MFRIGSNNLPHPNAKGANDVKRLKTLLALLACIVLFAGAIFLVSLLSPEAAGNAQNKSPIVLSEILAGNRTYPAPNGQFLDYIEIRNDSSSPVDISGYMLGDQEDSVGYTFPKGTVLNAHSYIVCWCDKESESSSYAKFGISKKGDDVIRLYNGSNVVIDRVEVPPVNDNVPLIRDEQGNWSLGTHATPGFENSDAGFDAWLESKNTKDVSLVISEVVSGGSYSIAGGEGKVSDWIELFNTGSSTVILDGAFLSDDSDDRTKWVIPQLSVEPGQRAIIRCAGSTAEDYEANFALSRDGCTVILTGTYGNTIAEVVVPELGKDCAWALQEDGTYLETPQVTPGYENSQAGYDAWLQEVGYATPNLVISEVMSANRSTIRSSNGNFCDWVELYNPSEESISLSGLYLSNDMGERMMWELPDVLLTAGGRIVIPCSGSNAPEGEATFSLPREGCSLVLSGSIGNVITQIEIPRLGEDRSWALQEDGEYHECDFPSPGYSNTQEGHQYFRASQTITSPLIISEVMPSNAKYMIQDDGEYYDWVEVKNISDTSISLSNYALSDDSDKLHKFILPDVTLAPGETYVVICSGNTDLTTKKYTHAPFTISREEGWVYLSRVNTTGCADFIRIYDAPYQHSVGRVDGENGTYYFTIPTPGTSNGTGVAFISETPALLTADGVFNNVDSLSVELTSTGKLYYTTDGSYPDEHSREYTGPIKLTKTTALRFVNIEEGKLPSDIITAVYIINENHTLPVVSIVAVPDLLTGGGGIYQNYKADREIRCNLKLFELDGNSFTIDAGVKMHGHTGLEAPKKSFKVNFRGRYGQEYLTYPVYGEEGPNVFDSLIIRAGQDYPTAIFRDELFTSLARDMSDKVLAQRDKFSILYVNGKYYGIYCIKEAWTELMYAQNMGGSPDNVEIVQAPVGASHEIYQLFKFCRTYDLSVDENYEYVASQVDIDSLIDWMIIEGYSTNGDVQQNLRYVRSRDTGWKWQFCLYDLDWSFYYHNAFKHVLSPYQEWQHLTLTRNIMKNAQFREKFLARTSELMATTLSNENVVSRIDYYENLLDPEVPRERQRWNGNYKSWKSKVQYLRDFIVIGEEGWDQMDNMINKLIDYIGLTDAEIDKYFSRWR